MDVASLKKFIFENNKVEYILESIEAHNIKHNENRGYYSASFKDGDNPKGIVIYDNELLRFVSFSRGISYDDCKDIINLVQMSNNMSFVDALKHVHKLLGLNYTGYKKKEVKEEKKNPLSIFTDVIKSRFKTKINVDDIHNLNESLVCEYIPILHISWFEDGVMPWAAKKFGLAYSYKYKRVIIPIRHWFNGSLLGFNQRTTVENFDELGILKYFITPTYKKEMNLYGLWENREEIERKKYCAVVESEKSVHKRYSRNDGTCVALQGKTMSEEQKKIILGLDINEIAIVLDNDVDINEIRNMCEKFYKIRKVSYIKDRWGLLGEKDSPCDASIKIYDFLWKYRTVYDYEEHMKYEESLKK